MARGAYHRLLCYAERVPATRTLAEALGFAPDDRVVVVHIDDLGLCAAANDGGFEVLRDGLGTSGSVMVPCPAFPEAAQRARDEPQLDLGLHLTLNCEFDEGRWGPTAPPDRVPSLLDEDGALLRSALETAERADPAEVECELRAQIETALGLGVDVTHLDAHMGTALFPPFLSIYTALADEYRIPAFAVRPRVERLRERGLEFALEVFRSACDDLEGAGLPVLDDFDTNSLGFGPGGGVAHTEARLATLQPGVTYWVIHPAQAGPGLEGVVGGSAHARAFEHEFYGPGGGAEALFAAAGIRRVGMREVRELARAGGPS